MIKQTIKTEVYVLFGLYSWGDKLILMINANENETYALRDLYQETSYGNFVGFEVQRHDLVQ